MDYVFMGNAACLNLSMQYIDLTMSLPGRVVFPLVLAPLGCLMQGTASTLVLTGKRPFPNRGIPASKTDSGTVFPASLRLQLSFFTAGKCNYSQRFRIRKLNPAQVLLVFRKQKETEGPLWHLSGLILNQGVVQCLNGLRDLRL